MQSARIVAIIGLLWLTACQRIIVPRDASPTAPEATPDILVTGTPERRALLQSVEGSVEARPDAADAWAAAAPGQSLNVGSQLRTVRASRAFIQLTEGSEIHVGADTRLTFNLLNPFMDSLLTAVALDRGQVWTLLNSGALDVETPVGLASARTAYMSVAYDPQSQVLTITCLQGVCSLGDTFIPQRHKYTQVGRAASLPEPMQFADYGQWGVNVPRLAELAWAATEAIAQGSATVPVVGLETATPEPPTATPTETLTPEGPTATPPSVPPTETATPSPPPPPTATESRPLPTPRPTYQIIGAHRVQRQETLYCIARVYGVLPAAIADANGLSAPGNVLTGQTLRIPAVQWFNILSGPVCAPQFNSPYPGLPYVTATPEFTVTPAAPELVLALDFQCIANCGSRDGEYTLRITARATGGVEPYVFTPSQTFEVTFPHCVDGTGLVTVTSADGQTDGIAWTYKDVSCPPPDLPTQPPTETPTPTAP